MPHIQASGARRRSPEWSGPGRYVALVHEAAGQARRVPHQHGHAEGGLAHPALVEQAVVAGVDDERVLGQPARGRFRLTNCCQLRRSRRSCGRPGAAPRSDGSGAWKPNPRTR